jgi:hypothetical protein
MSFCKICNQDNCKKHTILFGKVSKKLDISGSSPPEIFVGRYNYPNVYTGLLSPEEFGNTESMSSPEIWHNQKFNIPTIVNQRNKLVYGRSVSNIKKPTSRFLSILQEIAMTHKSVSTEMKLKKPISKHNEKDTRSPIISNAAPIQKARLTENTKIKKKIDYLVNDTDVKSATALKELYQSDIPNSQLTKILSAGLLGIGRNRKLVPTRWSITAVDDTLSKNQLKELKFFPTLDSYQVFSADYLGNHYVFLLLPDYFSFEVIELSLKSFNTWHDHESFFARKKYATSVTGAYYANRLALTEHLTKIKRQASCIVMREIRPSYYAPLGVGILRQTSREAFTKKPFITNTLQEALEHIRKLFSAPLNNYTDKSVILKNFKKQSRLADFLIY